MDEGRHGNSDRSSQSGWSNKSRSRSGSPQERKAQSRLLFISNIPYEVTWTQLKDIFHENVGFSGFLKMAQINGRPTGLATMEFKSLGGAAKAIEVMNQFTITERKIIVREATPRDLERLSKYQSHSVIGKQLQSDSSGVFSSANNLFHAFTSQELDALNIEPPLTDSVYISNLNYNVKATQLTNLFKAAGRIISAVIKTDSSGSSRGTAVVSFSHPYEAVQAVAMFNNKLLKDREMRVRIDRQGKNPMHPPLYPPGSDPMSLTNAGVLSSGCMEPCGTLNTDMMTSKISAAARALTIILMSAQTGKDTVIHGPDGLAGCLRVWTANVMNEPSRNVNSNALSQAVSLLTQLVQQTQQHRSYPYQTVPGPVRPEFQSPVHDLSYPSNTVVPDGAQQLLAAAMAGGMPESEVNRVLRSFRSTKESDVDECTRNYGTSVDRSSSDHGQSRARVRLTENTGVPFVGHDNFSGVNYAELSNMELPVEGMMLSGGAPHGNSRYRPRRSNNASVALVRNVPPSYEWHDVKRLFREVGEVLFCKMPLNAQGRTHGVAHVGFRDASDCLRAIARFNGNVLEGCRLEVCPN